MERAGWAVDLHLGSVTRAHDDVDVAVWLDDLPRIGELLAARGWNHVPSPGDDGGTGYQRGGVRLELTYLGRETGVGIYIPLRSGRAAWPADALGEDEREALRAQARVVALTALMRSKSSPRDEPDEAAKDRVDFRALSEL